VKSMVAAYPIVFGYRATPEAGKIARGTAGTIGVSDRTTPAIASSDGATATVDASGPATTRAYTCGLLTK